MDRIDSRTEPRVLYRAPVWLRPSESGTSLVGETRNLSRRGMFVQVTPTPALGSEIVCELPGQPALRGRVAWVFEGRTDETRALTGIGIEIVDLTQPLSFIDDLAGPRLDDNRPMELRFAGLPSPIRATGRVTHEGVELSTVLGFLRLGERVQVGTVGEAVQLEGRVARVGIQLHDEIPRLQITIAVPDPGDAEELPALALQSSTEPEPASLALDAVDERWFPEVEVILARMEPTTAAIEAIDPEPTERTVLVRPSEYPGRPRHRRRWGLPIALGATAVLALVLLMQAPRPPAPRGDEAQVEVTTVPTLPPAAPVAAPLAEAPAPHAVAPPTEPPLANVPVLSPEHPAEPDAEPESESSPAQAKPEATAAWHPQIAMLDGTATITVPVTGTRGLSTFSMSDPPGIGIDLPHGKTEVPLRSYLLHDPSFSSLWLRTRPQGGLQIRLHVARGVHVAAEPIEGGLRLRRIVR